MFLCCLCYFCFMTFLGGGVRFDRVVSTCFPFFLFDDLWTFLFVFSFRARDVRNQKFTSSSTWKKLHLNDSRELPLFQASGSSQELGACPPLGYWDPFGMMAFQDCQMSENTWGKQIGIGHIMRKERPCIQELSCSCLSGFVVELYVWSSLLGQHVQGSSKGRLELFLSY